MGNIKISLLTLFGTVAGGATSLGVYLITDNTIFTKFYSAITKKRKFYEVFAEYIDKEGNEGKQLCEIWMTREGRGAGEAKENIKEEECNKLVNKLWKGHKNNQPDIWIRVKKDKLNDILIEKALYKDLTLKEEIKNNSWEVAEENKNFKCTKEEGWSGENKEKIIVKCQKISK